MTGADGGSVDEQMTNDATKRGGGGLKKNKKIRRLGLTDLKSRIQFFFKIYAD